MQTFARKRIEGVEKVELLVKAPEKKGNGYVLTAKSPKGVKLGNVATALQTVFEKKSVKALTDVQWFAAEKKGDGKGHS